MSLDIGGKNRLVGINLKSAFGFEVRIASQIELTFKWEIIQILKDSHMNMHKIAFLQEANSTLQSHILALLWELHLR